MKKIILPIFLILLLLINSCVTVEVPEEIVEVPEETTIIEEGEDIEEEIVEVPEETEYPEQIDETDPFEHKIKYGETITVRDMDIKLVGLTSTGTITFELDGEEKKLEGTKNEEIYNNFYFSNIEYNYVGEIPESYVILKITDFELNEHEYLLYKDKTINVNAKDITLETSKSDQDGYIQVTVCDEGTIKCVEYEGIYKGTTEIVRGLSITNIKNYYRVNQYAIVKITF